MTRCGRLSARGSYRSPRLSKIAAEGAGADGQSPPNGGDGGPAGQPGQPGEADQGEIVVVVGYGRVPHKVAVRLPIGLALTYFSGALSPGDVATANKLAAQGLVTWINYPSLAPDQGSYDSPTMVIDQRSRSMDMAVDVSHEVRKAWKAIEGGIIVSAITRLVSRYAVGAGIQAGFGKDSILGVIASIGAQATLTALDTPDTRSWETLPARVAVARLRVPAGRHTVRLSARGVSRDQVVDVAKGDFALVSLMALR